MAELEITTVDPKRHPLAYHAAHSDGEKISECSDSECMEYIRFMNAIKAQEHQFRKMHD